MGCITSTVGKVKRGDSPALLEVEVAQSHHGEQVADEYTRGKHLGSGRFGNVYLCTRKGDGKIVAIKYIDFSRYQQKNLSKSVSSLLSEIDSMRSLGAHKNIVQLFESKVEDTSVLMVMEFCAGGSFRDYLEKNAPVKDIVVAEKIVRDIAGGLRALRVENLIHRDLKPENVLLDAHGTLKLADFGMARQLGDGDDANRVCGSLLYIAPEVFAKRSYKPSIDLWALGCMVYETIIGDHPFMTKDVELSSLCGTFETAKVNMTLIKMRRNAYGETETYFPKNLPPSFGRMVSLTTWLIQEDPAKRMTYKELFRVLGIEQIDDGATASGQDEKGTRRAAVSVDSKPSSFQNLSKAASYLRTLRVEDVQMGRAHLIVISAVVTVQQAIATLHSHGISSAPVLDEQGCFCGFVDNGDLVKHIIDSIHSKTKTFLRAFVTSSTKVVNYGKSSILVNKPVSIQNRCNLLSAILLMGTGVKRLGVWDNDGRFIKVISQSSVNNYLYKSLRSVIDERSACGSEKEQGVGPGEVVLSSSKAAMADMRETAMKSLEDDFVKLASMTLAELGLVWADREVVTALESSKVVDAFQLLSTHEISAIPVVDEGGLIRTVLSTADIAVLATDDFALEDGSEKEAAAADPAHHATMQIKLAFESIKRLDMSVIEYVTLARKCKTRSRKLPQANSAIVATSKSTLLSVMESLYKYSIHRVFIVNDKQKPIGVVSLKDVLKTLALHRLGE